MVEQDCARMEEEYEKNVTTEPTVGTIYSITSPLVNIVIKKIFKWFITSCHFNIKNMQLTVINFLSTYINSALLCCLSPGYYNCLLELLNQLVKEVLLHRCQPIIYIATSIYSVILYV